MEGSSLYLLDGNSGWVLSMQPKVVIGVLFATAISFSLTDHVSDVAKYTPRFGKGTLAQNLFYCSHLAG